MDELPLMFIAKLIKGIPFSGKGNITIFKLAQLSCGLLWIRSPTLIPTCVHYSENPVISNLSLPFFPVDWWICAVSQSWLGSDRALGWLWLSPGPCLYWRHQSGRIKDFKHACLAVSLTAMFLLYVFPFSPPPPPTLLFTLLISDAASQFNGHYDQIPGRDWEGSE